MTDKNPTVRNRWEAHTIQTAVLGILRNCHTARLPMRGTCPDCRALLALGEPCPICTELRRRHHARIHVKTA